MIRARPRASLRSVLFGIVFIAALACRVSMWPDVTFYPDEAGRFSRLSNPFPQPI